MENLSNSQARASARERPAAPPAGHARAERAAPVGTPGAKRPQSPLLRAMEANGLSPSACAKSPRSAPSSPADGLGTEGRGEYRALTQGPRPPPEGRSTRMRAGRSRGEHWVVLLLTPQISCLFALVHLRVYFFFSPDTVDENNNLLKVSPVAQHPHLSPTKILQSVSLILDGRRGKEKQQQVHNANLLLHLPSQTNGSLGVIRKARNVNGYTACLCCVSHLIFDVLK